MVDENYMRQAMAQAKLAQEAGEVPVGAVVVDQSGKIVAVGANAVLTQSDPTAHAELVALREAARVVGNYRLPDLSLYVTLEPCTMCLGAIFHARLQRIVFGASDPKTGACGGRLDLTERGLINHHTTVQGGVLASECADLLTRFFSQKRQAQANMRKAAQALCATHSKITQKLESK